MEIEGILKKGNLKNTIPRKEILSILIKQISPITAYELKDNLHSNGIDLNISTVYRVLDSLIEKHIVHKIQNTNTYMICGKKDKSHCHHFMICKDCGKVDEFESPEICKIEEKLSKEMKFKPLHHSIEIMGTCVKCN